MELEGLFIEEEKGYFNIYNKKGKYLCRTLDKETAEEIVTRVNEHDYLKNNLEYYRKLMEKGLEAMTLLILKGKEEY